VELQQSLGAIQKQGLGVAAISYDSIGTLKNFTDRQHIAYPLLWGPGLEDHSRIRHSE
jgi:peroxiredoxin